MTEARGALALEELVAAAVAEDVGDGDRTTGWTVPDGARGEAYVIAREGGLVAGHRPVRTVFRLLDPEVDVRWFVDEGGEVQAGGTVARLDGPLAALLTGERVALNFLGRLSGIATLTARYVAAVEETGCRVTDTRKTTPGWRALEKAATAAGGAVNHRMGLYDMVLVKENHLRAAGGVGPALREVLPRARAAGLEVGVEVTGRDELAEALAEGPDRILLDNMAVPELRAAVERVRERDGAGPLLEASGGVTLETVREIAETGVDLVSVGALTHSAPALDLSMLVREE